VNKLGKLRGHLQNALNMTSDKNALTEAKKCIINAIRKVDEVARKDNKKEQQKNYHQEWWGDIVTNAPAANMSPESSAKALVNLDAMIKEENDKLEELQKIQEEPQK